MTEENVSKTDTAESIDRELEQLMDQLEKPYENFNKPLGENEFNLLNHVREAMVEAGLGEKMDIFNEHRLIQEAEGRNAHAQQFNLTRYFAGQLMVPEADTSMERYSLMYEVRADHWLQIFKDKVLPSITFHNLPVKL